MIGAYHLLIKFGEAVVPITTSVLRELTIIQDYNKLLPEFRLRVTDSTGLFTHLAPFDKNMSKVYIELGHDGESDDINRYTFDVYERNPIGSRSDPSAEYDAQGLLACEGLFSPSRSRGFTGSIKTALEGIGAELNTDITQVSESLNYSKNLIQPSWNDAQLLNYLKTRLIGVNGEYAYKCFIKTQKGKTCFVFRDIEEMMQDSVSYKFIMNDTFYEDNLPIFNYFIYDDYKIQAVFSSKQQSYSYFDYDTSEYTTATENVENYLSLSDFFLIDNDDTVGSNDMDATGRSNDFTADFKGDVKSSYGNRLAGLAKMWITTVGLPNAVPGQTIQIFFPQGAEGGDLFAYQYGGYWLVERVVHNCGDTFLTKLLLTRHGLDTDKKTTLLKATKKKKA